MDDKDIESSDPDSDIIKPTEIIPSKSKYKNLVLSGGSTKAISHIGAIQKLIDNQMLDLKELKSVAGVSAGAMIGLFVALGFSIEEIWELIYQLDFQKIVSPNLFIFLEKCGMETGQIIYNFFEEILDKKTKIKHINFKQLYDLTGIKLIIVGSCLTTREPVYYDYINTPTFKVSVALRISISMPVFFTPVDIDKNKYIDGAVLDNYPMHLFKEEMEETIGILICNNYSTKYQNPEEYLLALVNLFMYNYYQKIPLEYSNHTIYINNIPDSIKPFSFNIDNETKDKLYQLGMDSVEQFIKNADSN